MLIRIVLLTAWLAACATPDPDQARRDQRPAGPTVSIGGGLGTYWGAGR